MHNPRRWGAVLVLLLVTGLAAAQTVGDASASPAASTAPPQSTGEPDDGRLGLALAGGGALGFAHLGVLLVLEEYGISPEVVVGTSMGSIVGVLYAAGYSPREILAIVESVDWNAIFVDEASRRRLSFDERRSDRLFRGRLAFADGELLLLGGASSGQSIIEFLDDLLRSDATVEEFDQLPRSLAVVAADLVSGDEVVYTSGDLKSAVRASMAVPGAFTPLFYDGRFLIDGGWVNNIPVDVAFDRGADAVIGVSLSLLNREASEIRDIPAILNQASRILRRSRIEENLARADVVITPDVQGFTPADFGRWQELIERGREAARSQLPALLALRERTVQHRIDPFLRPERDVPVTVGSVNARVPDFVEVPNLNEVIGALRTGLAGTETTVARIQTAVYGVYDTGRFRYVSYDLVPTGDGAYDVDVYLVPRTRTVSELRVGLGVRTQLVESTYVRSILHADFRAPLGFPRRDAATVDVETGPRLEAETWLSDVGSARVGVSVPVARDTRIRGRLYSLALPLPFYDRNTVEALYFRRTAGGDLGIRIDPGRQWRFDVQGFGEWAWTDRQQGASVLDDPGIARVGTAVVAQQDNLDRGVYPHRGTETRADGRVWWTPEALDPTVQLQADHRGYVPAGGDLVLSYRFAAATDLDSGLSSSDQFSEGGIERVAGFYFGELRGRHALSAGLGARLGIFDLPLAVGERAYLLAGVGATTVWQTALADAFDPATAEVPRFGGQVGLGFDTVLGELRLGVAVNDSYRVMSYLLLGPVVTPGGEIWSW